MPQKNKKLSNEQIVEKIFEPLNRADYCFSQYDDESELIGNNVNKIFYILNVKNEIISYNEQLKKLENKKTTLEEDFETSNGCNFVAFYGNIEEKIEQKTNLKNDENVEEMILKIAKGETTNIEKMSDEDFKKLKEGIDKCVSYCEEKNRVKKEIRNLENKFEYNVRKCKVEDIKNAREFFFKLKKDYNDLVMRKSKDNKFRTPYIIYVPSFLELDEDASDETIVNKFKEWVEISCVEAEKVYKKYGANCLRRIYSEFKERCRIPYGLNFYQFFWTARRSDPKFKEALNKKKKDVLDSMNKKENNEDFNIKNQINNV